METYHFTCQGLEIPVDFYRAAEPAKGLVVYYHGGGLMYGSGRDLPGEYIQAITQGGYHLVCMNYLLAPESPLEDIVESGYQGLMWVLAQRGRWLGDSQCPYILFGRSAGAFLALTLAHRVQEEGKNCPAALWLFYGYHHLDHPDFHRGTPYYLGLPQIPAPAEPQGGEGELRCQAGVEERYHLYVRARQQGTWPQVLRAPQGAGVPRAALGQLPPAFLTASTADQDVPYVFSQIMHVSMPNSCLLPVYGLEHDYDRNPRRLESQMLYQKVLEWTDDLWTAGKGMHS